MGGKSSAKMEVAEYRLSIHMGVCVRADKITALYIDEKKFWEGEVTANTTLDIHNPELFGGIKGEGGVSGQCHVLMGGDSQVLSDFLAAKLTGEPGVPGFRGLVSLFFTGFPGDRPGFYWSANQPYIKPVWVTVHNVPGGLNSGIAQFPDGTVNFAHIIYELMTIPELGMGAPPESFDLASWNAAAQTLWDEGMGGAFAWVNQSSVEQIVKEMQDHINGWVFQHPRTGKWTIKLVRDDYDVNDLPVITPNDAIFSNFQRKGLGETVNEIVATWTNPENEQEETVTVHDLGNIAAQGGIVSDSRNYYAIRNASLAARLALRDIRVAAAPLAACDVILNRKYWDLVPGDVVKVTWPDYGLNELVMRVGKVDYGAPGSQAIKVNLVEDVFAVPVGSYVTPPATSWVDPSKPPAPIPSSMQLVVTLPTYFLANLTDAENIEDPEVRAGTLVSQTGGDTFEYKLLSYLTNSGGTPEWTHLYQKATLGYGVLPAALAREASSTIGNLAPLYGSTFPKVGAFIWIGAPENFSEANDDAAFNRAELCLITGSGIGGWTVRRGVLDTQPLAWDAGTPFWIIDPAVSFDDIATIRAAGELARYKALPITSQGSLDESLAVEFNRTLSRRPHMPMRPADVRINNVPWGPTTQIPMGGDAVFTWSNRNRLTEVTQILDWTAASISPEDDQETVIELFDGTPKADNSYGLRKVTTGTSQTVTYAELISVSELGHIGWSMYTQRDGLTSFSRVGGIFEVEPPPTPIQVAQLSPLVMFKTLSSPIDVAQLSALTVMNPGAPDIQVAQLSALAMYSEVAGEYQPATFQLFGSTAYAELSEDDRRVDFTRHSTVTGWRKAVLPVTISSGATGTYWAELEVIACNAGSRYIAVSLKSTAYGTKDVMDGSSPVGAQTYSYFASGEASNPPNYVTFGDSYSPGDRIGVLLNRTTGEISFYKNGVLQGTHPATVSGQSLYLAVFAYSAGTDPSYEEVAVRIPEYTLNKPSGAAAWPAS